MRSDRRKLAVITTIMIMVSLASPADWYTGDERCPPPARDNDKYSAPYKALEHPHDYPTFSGADKPGWACSYQRDDGVIVQYGDGRTPQEQWKDVWDIPVPAGVVPVQVRSPESRGVLRRGNVTAISKQLLVVGKCRCFPGQQLVEAAHHGNPILLRLERKVAASLSPCVTPQGLVLPFSDCY